MAARVLLKLVPRAISQLFLFHKIITRAPRNGDRRVSESVI